MRSYATRMKQVRGEGMHVAAKVLDAHPQQSLLRKKNKSRRLIKVVKRAKSATKNPKRSIMARARKRARTASGHFKKVAKKRKSNPTKRKRTAAKRPAKRRVHKRTAKKRVTRVKRALGRKKSNGRFVRRGKTRVRGYRRKVKGRRKKTLVRSHMSYERPAPKRRRRRRAAREEEVVMENPRRRKRRSKARKHRRHVMENPRPRKRRRARTRRRSASATMPAVVRRRTRKGGTKRTPATVRVVIAGLGGRGRSKRRRSTSKRRSGARKRKHARKKRKGYTRRTHADHQLGQGQLSMFQEESGMFENPLGGYALENPLSGGELALAFLTGTIGYGIADFLDRWMAVRKYNPTVAPTTAGQTNISPILGTPNITAINTAPGIMRILAQAALAAVPLAGSYYAHKPMVRASLQGMGLGALFHLGGQLVNHYVMAKLAAGTGTIGTTLGQYYQEENQADSAATASGLSGIPVGLLGGVPLQRGVGAPTRARVMQRNPSIPYKDPGPRALAASNCNPCATVDPCDNVGCDAPCSPCDTGIVVTSSGNAYDAQMAAQQAAVSAQQASMAAQQAAMAANSGLAGTASSGALGSIGSWFSDSE